MMRAWEIEMGFWKLMHLDEKGDGGISVGAHPRTVKLGYPVVAAYWCCWVERTTR